MTGFGQARGDAVAVEVRAVNNRHLKLTVRGTDPYPQLEPEFEKVVRQTSAGAASSVQVRVDRAAAVGRVPAERRPAGRLPAGRSPRLRPPG